MRFQEIVQQSGDRNPVVTNCFFRDEITLEQLGEFRWKDPTRAARQKEYTMKKTSTITKRLMTCTSTFYLRDII